MFDRSKLTAGLVITGMSFALGLVVSRDWIKAASTSAIAVSASAVGAAALEKKKPEVATPVNTALPVISEPVSSQQKQIAIFWDYENVRIPTQGTSAPLAELLVDYAKSLGHPCLKIVYANWSGRQPSNSMRRGSSMSKEEVVVKALYSLGFEPIYVSMGKANSSDVKLAVDCLNSVHREPSLEHIIIVTGDKDFIPLVNALKDMGKTVTIIGHADKVSEHLMLSADEFVSVRELLDSEEEEAKQIIPASAITSDAPSPEPKSKKTIAPMPYDAAVECLLEALGAAIEQSKSTRIETIGRLMRTINSQYLGANHVFTPNKQGTFTKFSAFLATVANEGKIRLETTEGGFKELFLPEEDREDESEFRSDAIVEMNREQWQTLIHEVQAILSEKGSLSFVPMLCLLSKAKQGGALAFLSHSSLRKALQQLIEIQVLVKEDEKLFRLQDDLVNQQDSILESLTQEAAV